MAGFARRIALSRVCRWDDQIDCGHDPYIFHMYQPQKQGIGIVHSEQLVKSLRVIEAAGVPIDWRDAPMGTDGVRLLGASIPLESLETVRRCGVALKGPLIADRCSGGV